MKFRLTPLVVAITLAFQPHAAHADTEKQLLKAAGTRVAVEAADYAIDALEQNQAPAAPTTQPPKKKRNWKFWQRKPKNSDQLAEQGAASPVAQAVQELNAAQIQEKLDTMKVQVAPSTTSPSKHKRKKSAASVKKKTFDLTDAELSPEKNVNHVDNFSGSLKNSSAKNTDSNHTDNLSDSLKTDSPTQTVDSNEPYIPPKLRNSKKKTRSAKNTDLNHANNLSGSLKTDSPEQTETSGNPQNNPPKQITEKPKKKKSWQFWKKDREPDSAEDLGELEREQELTPKYPIDVHTDNEEVTTLLKTHLPIISYQKREEMDDEQISYLVEDTPKDVQNLVRTEGYFNAKTQVTPQKNVKGYRVDVALGQRTVIDNVNVAIVGDILQDNQLATYYKQALTGWKLPVGATFRQEDWSASKIATLSAVTRKKYPLARLSQTQATINPNTNKADLTVMVESQQPVLFGEMEISGHQRYPKSVISGLADFKAGDEYDLDKLLDYQQALENDSHYSGASVQADFDAMVNNRVPVKVEVSEVKRQKVEAGLSFDSEYGLGGKLSYDHYNLFNRGYVGSVSVEADKYQTIFGVGMSQPRNAKGQYWTSNLTYNRSTTQNLEKRAISTGIWHVQDKNDTEWRYGLEFLGEDSHVPDTRVELGKSFATMLTAQWKKHHLETRMRPQNGYYADVKLGTTLGKVASSAMMARANARAAYYFTPENKQLGTVVARGNVGYVYTNEDNANGQVPTSLMFRTGGATTVRGYELDSIGLNVPNSKTVLPNRAMAVASFEYQYPIQKKLAGQEFAVAVFHDVGGVARKFQDMEWKHGSGLGVRWFSPVAPFSFDVAYGHQDKKFRWHISLGTRF
ncbi:Outer membrane protein/protective antigen OMA87 [Alysiella crassa]|uniref:Outer membrane protein/protective antigen OMA87 n=1 Tax=Alysiella crassa TaxID=153491 RepID=A0A376BKM3_9NEIS|nr:Outer membrane protein/protective antigen OMA87 [Alysiella crassa]